MQTSMKYLQVCTALGLYNGPGINILKKVLVEGIKD